MRFAVAAFATAVVIASPHQDATREAAAIAAAIRRADYQGDRVQLRALHARLEPLLARREVAARVHYWRGFAMWRRALNGFNDGAPREEIAADLSACVAEFRQAIAIDSAFADAKGGAASCLVNASFLKMGTPEARTMYLESLALLEDALAAAPGNPRLLWIHGANQWYGPPGGGGQDAALATYAKGLAAARESRPATEDPLEPRWGEPELLMNLAFAHLNRAKPDPEAAEKHARAALALVPDWHYVRDILLPQILKAKGR